MAFEAAQSFASRLALGLLAGKVGLCRWVDPALSDRDAVQGAVQLAVAAAVEPVADVACPRRRGSGRRPPGGRTSHRLQAGRPRRSRRPALRRSGRRSPAASAAGDLLLDPGGDLGSSSLGAAGAAADLDHAARGRSARWSPCSARESLRATRSSQTIRSRQRAGSSSSGQRSCRCQRRRCWSSERALMRSSRWSSSSFSSSASSSRWAAGRVSGPSRRAARATARASIASDLPAVSFATPALAHQLRRDPHHPFAACHQEALQRAGDVAAVLDRPDPLGVELAAPGEQLAESRLPRGGGQLAGDLAAGRKDGAAGVGLLVGIRSDHDHLASSLRLVVAFGRTSG